MLPLAITACGSTKFVPQTRVVVLQTEASAFEHVPVPSVVVKKNEDLDRKALRLEDALGECNTRLDELKNAQAKALEEASAIAKDQSAVPWWRRLTGGGK